MLTTRFRARAALTAVVLLAAGCSSQTSEPEATPPSTVAPADAASSGGLTGINVGIVLNATSPTADRDARLADVMEASATAVRNAQAVDVHVEAVTISDLAEVPAAVADLVNRGVTVIATSCDDSSMPAVVDAAIEAELLAVTGCVAIPKPELDISNRLFIDLASLDDAPTAMAQWAHDQGHSSIAVLSSELIPDVSRTCTDVEDFATAAPRQIEIAAKGSFVELVDDPAALVASLATQLPNADAIVVCALAPALGDTVAALRSAGLEQPVLVPWFGEPQVWSGDTSDVFVFSPSSQQGDDPSEPVLALYDELGNAEAVDVVAADTLAAIAAAAEASQSVGSRRIADALRGNAVDGLSGKLVIGQGVELPVTRVYRVLEVADGKTTFVEMAGG